MQAAGKIKARLARLTTPSAATSISAQFFMPFNTHAHTHTHNCACQNMSFFNVSICPTIKRFINTLRTKLYLIGRQSVPRSKHTASVLKTSQLMLYGEIIAVCSEIHTKHTNTLCRQNVELLNVKLAVHIVTTGL